MATATTAVWKLAPKVATITTANSSGGKAKTTSKTREMRPSVKPPR